MDAAAADLCAFVEPYCCRKLQIEGTAGFVRWLALTDEARAPLDGRVTLRRSTGQLIAGMGLERGPNVRASHDRWRNQIDRWADYLAPLGVTVTEAPAAPGRRACLLLTFPATLARHVRGLLRGRRRPVPNLRTPAWWPTANREVSPPSSGGLPTSSSSSTVSYSRTAGAGARARDGATTTSVDAPAAGSPAPPSPAVVAERSTAASIAVAEWAKHTRRPPRLSRAAREQLERYAELYDGLRWPGAAAEWLSYTIADTFDPDVSWGTVLGYVPWDRSKDRNRWAGRPRSLAYFVRLLRREYRLHRKARRR